MSDLGVLARDLDLVVVGYHPKHREKWKGADDLIHCSHTGLGREWLEACSLRIYAPADWLIRWRYFFSRKLGFRWIPSSVDDPGPIDANAIDEQDPNKIETGAQIERLLQAWGWTQERFAKALSKILKTPVSRRRVIRHINGESRSPEFFAAVERLRKRVARSSEQGEANEM